MPRRTAVDIGVNVGLSRDSDAMTMQICLMTLIESLKKCGLSAAPTANTHPHTHTQIHSHIHAHRHTNNQAAQLKRTNRLRYARAARYTYHCCCAVCLLVCWLQHNHCICCCSSLTHFLRAPKSIFVVLLVVVCLLHLLICRIILFALHSQIWLN